MVVMKFGGTSVESQEAVARVTRIVEAHQHRQPVVVVSAMGGTTNKLLKAGAEAEAGRRDQALGLVDELRTHHLTHGLPLAGGGDTRPRHRHRPSQRGRGEAGQPPPPVGGGALHAVSRRALI